MSSNESETRTRILAATWQLMEQQQGSNVRMGDVAKTAGLSRQAVYLHFSSRAELMIATARYGDQVRNLDERLKPYRAATTGKERLETFIAFWGNYIPEIYGVAKALLATRETDAAVASAWQDRMDSVKSGCREIIGALGRDRTLSPNITSEEAADLLWTLLSIRNWENLVLECGWSTSQYVSRLQELAKDALVRDTERS